MYTLLSIFIHLRIVSPSKAATGGGSSNPMFKKVKLRTTARISIRPVWGKDLLNPLNHISNSVPKTFETSSEKPTSEEFILAVPKTPALKITPMDPKDSYFLPPNLGIPNLDYTYPDLIHDSYYSLTIESLDSTFAKIPNIGNFDYPQKPSVPVPHSEDQGENFRK
ncbi:hypothetical protein HanHA300_Chr01g0009711 [Helianthus annuus]|nr:hypothetical protein HanHA300_Chr01g0009711 [Helianthus annuus]KAJ0621822.1 hypothetical protein HanIR_Chr01g0013051 [Helianthus annuus]